MSHRNIKSVKEACLHRRAIRRYTDDPIPEEDIREILTLCGLAPSPGNLQPWRVVVVRGRERLAELQPIANNQKQVGAAAALFVLYSDMLDVIDNVEDTVHPGIPEDRRLRTIANTRKEFTEMDAKERENFGRQINYIFLGYLVLTLDAFGYSSSPMLGFDQDGMKKALGLRENAEISAIVAAGYAAEDGFTHHRHPLERFVRWDGE
ncbi:MAG: nitroreductase family protein [Fimbriimonadaceae bacterium]|nr:nitroreductase family protein [Fimbriimonadaceae bacterium]